VLPRTKEQKNSRTEERPTEVNLVKICPVTSSAALDITKINFIPIL